MSALPIPRRMENLPRHGGLPIPYIVARHSETGVPMFSQNHFRKQLEVIENHLCGQCGKPFMGQIAFLGGEEEIEKRFFIEPGVHEPCGKYAYSVCPYLSHSGYVPRGKKLDDPGAVQHPAFPKPDPRPEKMGMLIARDYRVDMIEETVILRPVRVLRVEWMR